MQPHLALSPWTSVARPGDRTWSTGVGSAGAQTAKHQDVVSFNKQVDSRVQKGTNVHIVALPDEPDSGRGG